MSSALYKVVQSYIFMHYMQDYAQHQHRIAGEVQDWQGVAHWPADNTANARLAWQDYPGVSSPPSE